MDCAEEIRAGGGLLPVGFYQTLPGADEVRDADDAGAVFRVLRMVAKTLDFPVRCIRICEALQATSVLAYVQAEVLDSLHFAFEYDLERAVFWYRLGIMGIPDIPSIEVERDVILMLQGVLRPHSDEESWTRCARVMRLLAMDHDHGYNLDDDDGPAHRQAFERELDEFYSRRPVFKSYFTEFNPIFDAEPCFRAMYPDVSESIRYF